MPDENTTITIPAPAPASAETPAAEPAIADAPAIITAVQPAITRLPTKVARGVTRKSSPNAAAAATNAPAPPVPEPTEPVTLDAAVAAALARGASMPEILQAIARVKAPATRAVGSAARPANLEDDMIITVLQPLKTVPGQKGLGGHARIKIYTNPACKTVGDFCKLGGKRGDINWDVAQELIAVAKPTP